MSGLVILGDTSGSVTLNAPAIAGSSTVTLPTTGGTILTNTTPGTVVQTVHTSYSTSVSINTTTPTNIGPQISITTKVANSKIYVSLSAPCQLNNGNAVRYAISWRNSTDNYASNSAVYPAVIESGWYELPGHFATWSNPSQPAGTTITYKLYAYRTSGSGGLYLIDSWGYGGDLPIVAMEIVG